MKCRSPSTTIEKQRRHSPADVRQISRPSGVLGPPPAAMDTAPCVGRERSLRLSVDHLPSRIAIIPERAGETHLRGDAPSLSQAASSGRLTRRPNCPVNSPRDNREPRCLREVCETQIRQHRSHLVYVTAKVAPPNTTIQIRKV